MKCMQGRQRSDEVSSSTYRDQKDAEMSCFCFNATILHLPGYVKSARGADDRTGTWAEYVKCPAEFLGIKPPSLSHAEAASLPLAAMTSLQALQKYKGGLSGKTVFVPGGRKLEPGYPV